MELPGGSRIRLLVLLAIILSLLIFGCTSPINPDNPVACTADAKLCPDSSAVGRTGPNCEFSPCPKTGNISPPDNVMCTDDAKICPDGSAVGRGGLDCEFAPCPNASAYKAYEKQSFYKFTDPNEGAFTIEVPSGWKVANSSGLTRPYIDAAVSFGADSLSSEGFFYSNPNGYIYATPNQVLEFAGFSEGSYYNPSGGISRPMIVMRYLEAKDYLSSLAQTLNATGATVIERPDLVANSSGPLLTRQTAAELNMQTVVNGKNVRQTVIAITSLIELQGTGVWSVSLSGYYTPEDKMNETEILVSKMISSFKVDPDWAKRENGEIMKRSAILSGAQSDISNIISSSFEIRSKSMDKTSEAWSRAILGTEDVYDSATGDYYVVDSGSNYYWINSQGDIFGTESDANPIPGGNLRKMDCSGC